MMHASKSRSASFTPIFADRNASVNSHLQAYSICPLVLLHRYDQDAVSVRRGGIVTKLPQWRVARKKWLLAVEDPQVSGPVRILDVALHSRTLCHFDSCNRLSRV